MPPRLQPRRVAREIALLSLSQLKGSSDKLDRLELDDLVLTAIRTLIGEIHETLETSAAEVTRGNEQLLKSETRATSLESAKAMVKEAIALTQSAINRLAIAVELPELVQLSSQYEVREYAIELIGTVNRRSREIDRQIEASLLDWQLNRLPRIDRDILRIAVAEMLFLDIPQKVAINEAVELAKRYSDEDGYRFINGVLRRVSDRLKAEAKS
ncbi:MAG: transcription antitermination protein NusB [Hydrococcus sp. C42_A2020_068]|uniref:transcription antitermination factor NusB n=1 Tax=Pleurocapsa sp. PCC 7327 TaxID=118163 RepID=UPI00029F9CED|nr:transcription antitermination factor NusB [Pleurocapsa sp. PCC 7327]AFY77814.1 NusB antitermination factor [Pleurocapsa sp. PCC 7327]MBF2021472.1 transcription antitermination protein NusB [Hydrococcus sp. C42_A2020_068]